MAEACMLDDAVIDLAVIDGSLSDGTMEDQDDDDFRTHQVLTDKSNGTDLSKSLLGTTSEKWEEIYEMYRKHSQAVGFSIRKATSRRVNGPGTPEVERYFVCSCEGKHGNDSRLGLNGLPQVATNNLRNAAITRCECKAGLRSQWQQHHRSERRISDAEAETIKAMTEAFVAPSVQYKVAAAAAGGDVFVGHSKRDHINFVHRLKIKAIEGGDAATLINLMTKRQSEDPGFFFCVQFNEEGRLCHLFWCDSMMREDYRLYHDVLIFDTMYRTNRYNLICGAFVAMGDDLRPVSIFTDQDKAMSNAVEAVYPQSRHRLWQWLIQKNAISHFGSLKHDRPFQSMFNKCLNGCFNETEFEATWGTMMAEYGLDNHPWFNRLYSLRTKWCTALNNLHFSAGILSSQRSESTNHAMGFQASKTTPVAEFFGLFETTVRRWIWEEERKEFNCIRATPTSVFSLVDLLQHASQIYTLHLFHVFEIEFGLAMGTRAAVVHSEDSTLVYRVHTGGNEGASHHVTYDCVSHLTDCTCRKYQLMGMFCSHIIRVLHMHSVQEIPSA
ncbi:protein FAR1-RELATED SEQUENCE 5-like [Silene latifolia]|uniref:protein FAR1-RELATED SEQUENCE 5-like n=1 Tax=Silene latifolia TaxID=37657 RepID=UPI003D779F0C